MTEHTGDNVRNNRAEITQLREDYASLRAELDALRDGQSKESDKLDSVKFYIAMKERGNGMQVQPSQAAALVAVEDNGPSLYSMHRFVKRYRDAFVEGLQ